MIDFESGHLGAVAWAALVTYSLLLVSTMVTFTLTKWKPQREGFQKVLVIIRSWWLIATAFLLMMCWYRWGLIIGLGCLSLLLVHEYLKVSTLPYKRFIKTALFLLIGLQYLALSLGNLPLFQALLPVIAIWIVPSLIVMRSTIKDLPLVVAVGFGTILAAYYLSHLAAITSFPQLGLSPRQATLSLFILIIVTWSNDVFQFLNGKTFGGPRVVPEISPNKTLGGFIGGMVCTGLFAALLCRSWLQMPLWLALFIGPILSLTGILGDLFFSAVKRYIGIKDFSKSLPGHGGLLDRMDSLIFTAPVFFQILLFFGGQR